MHYQSNMVAASARVLGLQGTFEEFAKLYRGIHQLSDVKIGEPIEVQILSILLDRLKTGEERTEERERKFR